MNKIRRISPSTIALLAAIVFLCGGFLLFYHYIQEKKIYAFSYMNTLMSKKEEVQNVENTIAMKEENEVEQKEEPIPTYYLGTLTIPKIGFQRGFLDKKAPGNNVEENITVLKESNYPDVEKGNFIIAAHSGPTANSFFNDLYQLTIGDTAQVIYQGNNYTYQLITTYQVPKTGTVQIKRNREKKTLTLITCTNYDSTTQSIYIFELI